LNLRPTNTCSVAFTPRAPSTSAASMKRLAPALVFFWWWMSKISRRPRTCCFPRAPNGDVLLREVYHAPGTGWATPQGTAARGKSLGEGRGAVFIPEKIRGTALKFSKSQYLAQPLCPSALPCFQEKYQRAPLITHSKINIFRAWLAKK
jgi:hypothetical protein